MDKSDVATVYLLGLLFVASSVGVMTKTAIGAFVFGMGLIGMAMIGYLSNKEKEEE